MKQIAINPERLRWYCRQVYWQRYDDIFNNGIIEDNSSSGSVSGVTNIGGLVGQNYQGTISNSSASAESISGGSNTSGFVGENDSGTYTDEWCVVGGSSFSDSSGGDIDGITKVDANCE